MRPHLPEIPYPDNGTVTYITDADYMNPALRLWTTAQIVEAYSRRIVPAQPTGNGHTTER